MYPRHTCCPIFCITYVINTDGNRKRRENFFFIWVTTAEIPYHFIQVMHNCFLRELRRVLGCLSTYPSNIIILLSIQIWLGYFTRCCTNQNVFIQTISSCYITIISYNSITISFYIDHVSSLFRMSMLIIGILPYHFFNNNPFSGHSAFKKRDNICTTVLKYINTWCLKSK